MNLPQLRLNPLSVWPESYSLRDSRTPPDTVGYGPARSWAAAWKGSDSALLPTAQVTWRSWDTGAPVRSLLLVGVLKSVDFVQPLSDGRVLLASSRRPSDGISAQIWNAQGDLVAHGDLGTALEHVLTTESDEIWVGYFDEALTGRPPEGHGLARFDSSLSIEWLFPWHGDSPQIDDCEALNVAKSSVFVCSYSSFHVVEIADSKILDFGRAPVSGADALLVDGPRMALIGGYGTDYDVVTPFVRERGGIRSVGVQGRLEFGGGAAAKNVHWTCRGGSGHVYVSSQHYELTVDRIFGALVQ